MHRLIGKPPEAPNIIPNARTLGLAGNGVQTTFNIIVKTDNAGVSLSNQFLLALDGTSTYNIDFLTSDGQSGTITSNADFLFTFPAPGTYSIKFGGVNNTLPHIEFDNGGDKDKWTFLTNWGNIVWDSWERMCRGCGNLTITASDIPDTSLVTNFNFAFQLSTANPNLELIDVSSGVTFNNMFANNNFSTPNTSNWNTPVAETFVNAFTGSLCNPDMSGFDLTNVTDMTDCCEGSLFDTTNYDLFLANADSQVVQSGVEFGAGDACYSSGGPTVSRDNLVTQNFWEFSDGGSCDNANFWEGTIDALYSTDANWSLGHVPLSTEVPLWIGDFNNPCTIDVNIDVQGFEIQSDYSSTVTQNAGVTMVIGSASMYLFNGTLICADSAISVASFVVNHGAAFTSTSDILTISMGNFIHTSGTFTHNSGQIIFTGNNQQIDADGVVFNKVKNINGNPASSFTINDNVSVVTEYFHDRGTLNVLLGKTISLQGDWVAGSDPRLSTSNQGAVEFDGTGVQELYNDKVGGLARIPAIRVNKSAGTLTMFDQVQFSAQGNVVGLEHIQGSVAFDASFVSIKSIGNGYEINWPAATAPLIPLLEQNQGNPNTGMSLAADFECTEFSGVDGDVFFTGFNFDTVGKFTHRGDLRGGTDDVLTVGANFDWADGSASGITGQWFLNVAGNAFADNVTVQDCNANGGNTVFATNSTDNGNTDNWDFLNSLFTTEDLNQFTTQDLNPVYV